LKNYTILKIAEDMKMDVEQENKKLNSTNHPKRKEWFTRGKKL